MFLTNNLFNHGTYEFVQKVSEYDQEMQQSRTTES